MNNVYQFTVTVTDNGTPALSATQAVTITVTNVVEFVGSTLASLAAGVLTITDTGAVSNDALTLSLAQGKIVISDPANAISVAGGVISTSDFQARIPLALVTQIVVNTGSGADRLIVNFANGNPLPASGLGLNYNGGVGPGDSLVLRNVGTPSARCRIARRQSMTDPSPWSPRSPR